MFIKFLVLIFISINLYAVNSLKNSYYVDSRTINLSIITSDTKNSQHIYSIDLDKHTKRVKAKDLIKLLKKHGYDKYNFKGSYINFILKSPIDTSRIKKSIYNYYMQNYEDIEILEISVHPRAYINSLPKEYIVNIRQKDFLSNSGVINIKTQKKRKIFFNYRVNARLNIYVSKKKIKKGVALSAINSSKKSIILDKFRAKPIQSIQKDSFESKYHISKDKILTIRDVKTLSVVKRNSFITVNLYSDNMAITFGAKALQDGKVNDIISVQKNNGKRFKVRVIGKNKAEIR
jgi:flagella basal body P-ring formation protein FlgA